MTPRLLTTALLVAAFTGLAAFSMQRAPATGDPAVAPADASPRDAADSRVASPLDEPRPPGPLRVALQAGHWKAAEAPDEQSGLRANGTRAAGISEWQVNLQIAQRTAALLEEAGYAVDILPTTIPPAYRADLFLAIHADGNANTSVSGYRAAAPRRDATGRAAEFVRVLEQTYGEATGLNHYPLVTRRMRSYYAFNHRRYTHALHPLTVGAIIETGFLSSPRDRRLIVDGQDRVARGIANAVIRFLGLPPVVEPLGSPARDQPAGTSLSSGASSASISR